MDQHQQAVDGDRKSTDDNGSDVDVSLLKLKPPNKKKFDDDIEAVVSVIRSKEAQLKNEQGTSSRHVNGNIREVRAERDRMIEQRHQIDKQLNALNKNVTEKMAALTRLKATLHYKSEDKVNDAIRRLEYQLKNNNFKLSEEKKIVAEIDSLKRSKKAVSQFLVMTHEMEEMRARQRQLRDERDHYFRAMAQLKTKEVELRRSNVLSRDLRENLKKEIDELYEQKRRLLSDYKKQEKDFNASRESRKKQRIESFKRREMEKKEAMQKEMDEYAARKGLYDDEITLCNTLIQYLQGFTSCDVDYQPQSASTDSAAVRGLSMVDQVAQKEGVYVLQRKSSMDSVIGASRKPRRSSKNRKSILAKPITHSPHVFEQFASLVLNAPSNLLEVVTSLEQLNARKTFYVSLNDDFSGNPPCIRSASASTDTVLSTPTDVVDQSTTLSPAVDADRPCLLATDVERQTSKTESIGSATESQTCDSIVDMLSDVRADARASTLSPAEYDEHSCPECDCDLGDHAILKGAKSGDNNSGSITRRCDDKEIKHSLSSPCFLGSDKQDKECTTVISSIDGPYLPDNYDSVQISRGSGPPSDNTEKQQFKGQETSTERCRRCQELLKDNDVGKGRINDVFGTSNIRDIRGMTRETDSCHVCLNIRSDCVSSNGGQSRASGELTDAQSHTSFGRDRINLPQITEGLSTDQLLPVHENS